MNNLIINIYIFISFISMYNLENKSIILYLLLIFQLMMFSLNLYFLLKRKNIKISKDIFLILFITFFSLIFNISTLGNYIINMVLVFNIYILTKYRWNYVYRRVFLYANIFNIINMFLYKYSTRIYGVPKVILGYTLPKVLVPQIWVASLSLIAIYSLFSISLIKNKLLKLFIVFLSVSLIIIAGKFTTILALLIVGMIYLLNSKFFILSSKKMLKYTLKTMLTICFCSPFIFYYFTLIFNKFLDTKALDIPGLFSGRNLLWIDYINYIYNNKFQILVGNGFFSDEKKISYLSHPHNQYLTIFYILGILGFIVYYLFYLKVIDESIKIKKQYSNLFMILIVIIFEMCGDDYFILTINPLNLIVIFLIYNSKFSINNIKMSKGKKLI
ncbi:hypothetical protein LDK02_06315 [Fusobacterium animalis]|uniref:hypothetical protein n=1 Tax=Fusobacterium animalis TaxID=76859 RepID=UPI0030CD32C9